MKRLVEREFPSGTVEANVAEFLTKAEPFQSPAGSKQRVRARLLGAPVRGHRPWLLRPAAVFDLGWLKLKAAANIRQQFALSDKSKEERFRRGGTGAVQFVFDPYIELGANCSTELVDHYSPQNAADPDAERGSFDGLGSVTTTAYGGFANARIVPDLLVGAGINLVHEEDQVQGVFESMQGFGAIQYLLGGQLYVKFVGGYAKAKLHPGGKEAWENTMLSGRLRLMYLF